MSLKRKMKIVEQQKIIKTIILTTPINKYLDRSTTHSITSCHFQPPAKTSYLKFKFRYGPRVRASDIQKIYMNENLPFEQYFL